MTETIRRLMTDRFDDPALSMIRTSSFLRSSFRIGVAGLLLLTALLKAASPATAVAPLVVGATPKPLVIGQPLGHDPRRPRGRTTQTATRREAELDAEALPTLGPTTAENRPPLPGTHTRPETMLLLPAPIVRLERSLHGSCFLSNQ